MSESIIRYKDLGVLGRWRMRRAARMCGNKIKPWLVKRFDDKQQYSLQEIRQAKRDASLNDREVAMTCGFFLNQEDFEEAARRFPYVLDQDDARRLIKDEVKGLTVLEMAVHKADGGKKKWDGGQG